MANNRKSPAARAISNFSSGGNLGTSTPWSSKQADSILRALSYPEAESPPGALVPRDEFAFGSVISRGSSSDHYLGQDR